MEQEFQTQLMKHAGAFLKLMNKLQDMVHCSLDLRQVIEKVANSPDVLYCEKVKKTAAAATSVKKTVEKNAGPYFTVQPQTTGETFDQPPAKKLKKPSKKIKLNTTDCLANDIIYNSS